MALLPRRQQSLRNNGHEWPTGKDFEEGSNGLLQRSIIAFTWRLDKSKTNLIKVVDSPLFETECLE
jgi:hypothetical protein